MRSDRDDTRHIPIETRLELYVRENRQCAYCFTFTEEVHHKKFRSRARNGEDIHQMLNLVLLCPECHNRTHDGDSNMAQYRTYSWQEIGCTEEEWDAELKIEQDKIEEKYGDN